MTRVSLSGLRRDPSESDLRSAVRRAAEEATDFAWLNRGDAVLVKPVMNSDVPYPATTHPLAVAAIVELLIAKGAGRVVVGEMAGIQYLKLTPAGAVGSTRQLMTRTGIAQAAEAAGGELHCFEEHGWNAFYEDWPAAGSHWKQGLMMPRILQEVDHVVVAPRCARHVLLGCTLGLKAAVGYWRTDTRLEYHRDAATILEKTAEANTVPTLLNKQRLVITVADKVLATFGPNSGQIVQPEVGLVIASESVVAHDLASLAWLLDCQCLQEPGIVDRVLDRNGMVAAIGNRWIVSRLGGWGPAVTSERLIKHKSKSVWQDRTLQRACEIFGRPQLSLDTSDDVVSKELLRRLVDRVTCPPAEVEAPPR